MSLGLVIDLGNGFTMEWFSEYNTDWPTGAIICGPAGPNCKNKGVGMPKDNQCGGAIHLNNSELAKREGRPMWQIITKDPLSVSPSIECACGDQHGHVIHGKWVKT